VNSFTNRIPTAQETHFVTVTETIQTV